jgi:uncharacterized MAPEG superfamily protein
MKYLGQEATILTLTAIAWIAARISLIPSYGENYNNSY